MIEAMAQDDRRLHPDARRVRRRQRAARRWRGSGGAKREVARLLGDVDAHDALESGCMLPAAAERLALHVVDRILAAEHEHEEQLGEALAERHDRGATPNRRSQRRPGRVEAGCGSRTPGTSASAAPPRSPRGRRSGTRVRRWAGRSANSSRPALEDVLELQPDLHVRWRCGGARCARAPPAAAPGTRRCAPSASSRGQLPARVVGVDGEGRGRPSGCRRRRRSA